MKQFLIIVIAVIFIILFIPLTVVLIMGKTVDNSIPFDAPETAQTVKVYVKQTDTVCDMDINTYLIGVVAAEIPADFELEAMKAQAVAARTYLASHMYDYASGNIAEEHKGAAICTDSTHCQAWTDEATFKNNRENANEKWDKIANAVKSTQGEIITYKHKPISAVFFSTSSGYTEAAEDVWGKEVPYLKGVKSSGDELSPRYTSETVISTEEFKKTAEEKAAVTDWSDGLFGNIKRSKAGGIKTIDIGNVTIKGTELRAFYGLRSTNAELEEKDGSVKISVKGFGHNVGMSQYGANYLATQGADYKEILKTYYSGVAIEKRN